MDTLRFEYFLWQLTKGECVKETCFYFSDDEEEEEHFLGFNSQWEPPYWVGYCDIPGGAGFQTAEELVNAPIFSHRSLKERWNEVRIVTIEALSLDDWIKYYPHF